MAKDDKAPAPPPKDPRQEAREHELAAQAAVEKAVHNLVYFGDGTPRPLPPAEPKP